MSLGLNTMQLPGVDHDALQKHLRGRHNILTQSMTSGRAPEVSGLRISPNVFHTPAELDRFVAATAAFLRAS